MRSRGRSVFILPDNASSHDKTKTFENVRFLHFIPHVTPFLQPLDMVYKVVIKQTLRSGTYSWLMIKDMLLIHSYGSLAFSTNYLS